MSQGSDPPTTQLVFPETDAIGRLPAAGTRMFKPPGSSVSQASRTVMESPNPSLCPISIEQFTLSPSQRSCRHDLPMLTPWLCPHAETPPNPTAKATSAPTPEPTFDDSEFIRSSPELGLDCRIAPRDRPGLQ
jgi:hypothetical protein